MLKFARKTKKPRQNIIKELKINKKNSRTKNNF